MVRLIQRKTAAGRLARLRQSNGIIGDVLRDRSKPGDVDQSNSLLEGVAVKDNIVTSDYNTTCASGVLKTYKSPFNASIVDAIRTAGGSVLVKTNMDEFGMGSHSQFSHFGPVTERGRSPGGSSGGSARAVALGASKIAIGTDTGGSVRLPAAYAGVCGFKPSYGRLSRYGVVPYANSLDTVGLLSRNVSRLKTAFSYMDREDLRDPTCLKQSTRKRLQSKLNGHSGMMLRGLRIGVPLEYNIYGLHHTIGDTWKLTLKTLQRFGCEIVPVSLPHTKHALSAYYVLAAAEAASNLSKFDGVRYGSRDEDTDVHDEVLYAGTRGLGFGVEVKKRILLGSFTLSSGAVDNYFIQAQKVRRLVQMDFDRVFACPNPLKDTQQFDLSDMDEGVSMESKLGPAQVDVLLCPTTRTLAPKLDYIRMQESLHAYMSDVFTVPASLAGLPAISIPVSVPKSSLDVSGFHYSAGMQIIGNYYNDNTVLNVADKVLACMRSNEND